jgi:hypothetical protein
MNSQDPVKGEVAWPAVNESEQGGDEHDVVGEHEIVLVSAVRSPPPIPPVHCSDGGEHDPDQAGSGERCGQPGGE